MKKFILLFAAFVFAQGAKAMDNVQFFGFIQPIFWHFQSDQDYWSKVKYNTGGVSQGNFFITADFDDNLSTFINFELINNFSTDKEWGAFNLQEAYLKWEPNNYVNLKFGQVIPQFNSMFEIYNRTPLLPYLLRPQIYEATIGNLVDIFDILPQKALVHLSGYMPVSDGVKLDYATYINHTVNAFHSSPSNDLKPYYVAYGQGASPYLGYGGRVGLRVGDLKVGISASTDKGNQSKFKWTEGSYPDNPRDPKDPMDTDGDKNPFEQQTADLGEITRIRIGADFSMKFAGFTLSGEYMMNKSNIDDHNVTFDDVYDLDVANKPITKTMSVKDFLKYANSKNKMFIGSGLDKMSYFATLQYNFTDNIYGYVMYDYLEDEINPYYFGTEGYKGFSFGAGWQVNDNVVLKAQLVQHNVKYDNTMDYTNYTQTDYSEMFMVIGTSIAF